MNLPPSRRSDVSAALTAAPVDGGLRLQCCARCSVVQYPPRERCGHCLADALVWQEVSGEATLLAVSALSHSLEPWFGDRLPWAVGSLRLDAGPVVFAHLAVAGARPGARLRVANANDASGAWCLVAFEGESPDFTASLEQLGIST